MSRRSALLAVLLIGSLWSAAVVGAVSAAPQHRLPRPPGGTRAARGLRLSIRPAIGGRSSHFVVSFTAGLTGFTFPDSTSYRVVASGGSSRTCRSSQRVAVPSTTPGQRINAKLMPSGPSGLWCAGRYAGRLQELFRPICGSGSICPLIARLRPSVIVVRSLGTFHFRVR